MKKVVYSRPTEKDAVLLTDLEGESMEISGPEMKASLQPGGNEKLYRTKAMPYFCKAGEELDVVSMTTKKLIWSSSGGLH